MKYALLIYRNPDDYAGMTDEEKAAVRAEYVALAQDDRVLGTGQLEEVASATTLRVRDGKTLTTDGPFAESKEVFGGYYLIDADTLDEAHQLAARIPAARLGDGAIEIRPLVLVAP